MHQIPRSRLQKTRYRMTTQFIVLAFPNGSAFAQPASPHSETSQLPEWSFASLARSSFVRFAPVATLLGTADARLTIPGTVVRVAGNCKGVIQAPKLEPQIVRYELSDYVNGRPSSLSFRLSLAPWNDRRVRSTVSFGPCDQACRGAICQRPLGLIQLATIASFAGDGLESGTRSWMQCAMHDAQDGTRRKNTHDAGVQMIVANVVRVHQHGACIAGNGGQHTCRSRSGLTNQD